jgi:ribose-phosphate pyrophosphokinase
MIEDYEFGFVVPTDDYDPEDDAFQLVKIDLETYPDSMPLGGWMGDYGSDESRIILVLRPKSFATFMAAMFWVDAFQERFDGYDLNLILPFIPGARQDRLLNAPGDFLFTAKSIAREINARNFESVRVFDPHSEVSSGLINRCQVLRLPDALPYKNYYSGIIAPDGGAVKRAGDWATALTLPLYHAWKKRDATTGKLTGFGVEPLTPGHYLVVDDICDGGGTFLGLAGVFAEGVTADLYVSHGLFTQGTDKLLQAYKKVITTNSTIGAKPGVEVLDILPYL